MLELLFRLLALWFLGLGLFLLFVLLLMFLAVGLLVLWLFSVIVELFVDYVI